MINSACNWGNYIITGALGLSHWFSSKVKALYSLRHTVSSNILLPWLGRVCNNEIELLALVRTVYFPF
jgi:hypothetical protein